MSYSRSLPCYTTLGGTFDQDVTGSNVWVVINRAVASFSSLVGCCRCLALTGRQYAVVYHIPFTSRSHAIMTHTSNGAVPPLITLVLYINPAPMLYTIHSQPCMASKLLLRAVCQHWRLDQQLENVLGQVRSEDGLTLTWSNTKTSAWTMTSVIFNIWFMANTTIVNSFDLKANLNSVKCDLAFVVANSR